jgi:hypothetical protein
MRRLTYFIREPWFINLLQVIGYILGVGCGLLAALGGVPNIVTFQLGTFLAVVVGSVLVLAGILGSYSLVRGYWGLEQVALWAFGIGYVALLIPTVAYAVSPSRSNSTLWLIVALEIQAIIATMIRYRRVDWAYLDPAK